ncbi:MAG: hypothetical protein KGD58_13305 [Candidatus Lokiarchaeota archaeon]|nr:hypothetical protein [Candidatus Lokiarchaeota archaeon]
MRKNLKIALLIASIVIVGGGGIFGIIVAVTWGEYKYTDTYYYDPQLPPSGIEEVSFSSDIGGIVINYNTTPTNNYVKIDLDIKLKGAFVNGKSFSDFFRPIIWINDSISTTTFSLEKKPSTWFLFPLIQKINISITLRTDIIYDISALTSTGSVEMNIAENVILNSTNLATSTGSVYVQAENNSILFGDLDLRVSTGSINLFAKGVNFSYGFKAVTSTGSLNLNLTNCIIGEDIKGKASTGGITLKSYNVQYDKNCVWDIETNTGSIDIEISQFIEMGADITGTIETSTGSIDLVYIDNQASVGASFLGSWSTGSYTRSSSGGGFVATNINPFASLDYGTASSTYTLDLTVSTGSIDVDGTSS